MSHHPDHPPHRHAALPPGKTIEAMLLERPAAPAGVAREGLHVCPTCGSGLVHPLAWKEAGPAHWEVTLRCPECYGCTTAVHPDAAIEDLDVELDIATEALMADLREVSRVNREEEIARFAALLQADLLLPEDF